MYLKALEMQGFKSFPQKTRLTFEKEITAIVGPNGSGKSNISDAVRWVMGEQSTRALRGGKMEDVIFGGTEKRAPMGFAEVSLILDNSGNTFSINSSEVMITRRFYRSGDSEYYINKRSCRLRDVYELLMDTGLGREGYSIISQGRIDEILSVKGTDRRSVFEEAAGISRFRYRKEEAEKKLSQADDNLLRINDKITELEMQVEPLKTQSETAKKYLVCRDELRGLEITTWLGELDTQSERVGKLTEDVALVAGQIVSAQTELDEIYAESEQLTEEIRGNEIRSEKARQSVTEAQSAKTEAENASAVLKATADANEENIAGIRGDMEKQNRQRESVEAQIKEYYTRLSEIEAEKSETESAMTEISAETAALEGSAGNVQAEISGLLRKESEISALISADEARLTSLRENAGDAEMRTEQRKNELLFASEKRKSAENDKKETEKKLKFAKNELLSLENKVSGYTMRVNARSDKLKRAEGKRTALDAECRDMRSEIRILSDMEREYTGYNASVRAVMQEAARGTLRGVFGTVGSLVQTEDRYALAVETALGAGVQNIIVNTDDDGKNVLYFLKRANIGRITVQPVSTVRGSILRENLMGERGFEGIASELIRCDARFEGVYRSLLGRTAVVDNLDNAVRLGKKYANRFRIVTLDGQMVNAGGSMTGGAMVQNAGIISRTNRLNMLRALEKTRTEELKAATAEAQSAQRELTAAQKEAETASEEKRRAESELVRTEAALSHAEILLENCLAAEAELTRQIETEAQRKNRLEGDIRLLTDRIKAELDEIADVRAEIETRSIGFEDITNQEKLLRDRRNEIENKISSLKAEASAVRESAEKLSAIADGMKNDTLRRNGQIQELIRENEEIGKKIAQLQHDAEKSGRLAEEYGRKIKQISAERLDIEEKRTRCTKKLQSMNETILNLQRESGRLEQQKISAELVSKQILDRLWDTYELSRTAARGQTVEIESTASAMRRIGELRREIQSLGTPNIGAIEEYERVNTRYTYLTEQRADIEKSRAELSSIIRDITTEMTDIFAARFHEINEGFKRTFTELFGGGKASLELEDTKDILNCGIEIKVQPPGKSLKTLTLLSGGERAFSAIALYFAILSTRPTPFVIMDEIESALDEVNNARFAEYMRKYTDRTQFLVITHRRKTMEEADVLYGVTMQEKGVSQVISVSLEQAERTISE